MSYADYAQNKDAAGFKTEFEAKIADAVADAIENKKIEIAQNFMSGISSEEGTEE